MHFDRPSATSSSGLREPAPFFLGADSDSAAAPPRRGAWLFAGVLVLAALMLSSAALAQTGRIGNFCAGQFVTPVNCTANDITLQRFFVDEIIESCAQGTPGEAEVVFQALAFPNQCDRFGIGIFVNLEGESAITGDLCLHDYLAPFSPNPEDWNTTLINGFEAFIEPFPEINGDQCGDCGGREPALKTLAPLRIQCVDTSGDGFVTVNACASWENNQNVMCSGLEDAVPGTPSKCGCGDVPTELAMPARLTIRKGTSDGSDETFQFTTTSDPDLPGFELPENFEITTSGGSGSRDFEFVEPGTYTVDEIVPPDWRLNLALCDNGEDPRTGVTLAPGQHVTCSFSNSPILPGSITITKATIGGDGSFEFTGDLGDFTAATEGGECCTLFTDLAAGTYSVTELGPPEGWDLVDISCSNDSNTDLATATADIELAEGESVTCVFTNVKRGRVTVHKETLPAGGAGFEFAFGAAEGPPVDFSLGDGEAEVFDNLLADTYSVAEVGLPPGWDLTGLVCGGGIGLDVDPEAGVATIDLNPGEEVVCTFTNTQRGSLTIEKVAIGGDGEFQFTSQFLEPGEFTLTTPDDASILFDDLPPSTYSVREVGPPEGWTLLDAACDADPGQWDFLPAENRIFTQVFPGQHVTCQFRNAADASVSLTKRTFGGDGTFGFELTDQAGAPVDQTELTTAGCCVTEEFPDLEPGQYTFTETSLPEGWALTAVSCTIVSPGEIEPIEQVVAGDLENRSVTFEFGFGDTVNCLFENTADGTVIIEKATVPAGVDEEFVFTGELAGTIGDGGELTVTGQPGSYTAVESIEDLPEGWSLTDIACQAGPASSYLLIEGDTGVDVLLAAGEEVRCVFTNTRDIAAIDIVKTASAPVVDLGQGFSYEVTVDGLGPDPALGVVMTDPLPAGVSFVSVGPAQCSEAGGTVTCDIGELAEGESFTATISVVVDDDAQLCDATLVNVASADGDNVDPVSDDAGIVVVCEEVEPVLVPVGGPLAWIALMLMIAAAAGLALRRRQRRVPGAAK